MITSEKMELLRSKVDADLGIKTKVICAPKNGIDCWGLSPIAYNSFCPVVYYNGESTSAYIQKVKELFDQTIPSGNFEIIKDANYLKRNTKVCVQRKSDEFIVKRPCLNLEAYLRVDVSSVFGHGDSVASVKITNAILTLADLTADELWTAADSNTLKSMDIESLDQLLGINNPLMPNLFDVITTRERMYGAAALRYPDIFRDYCKSHQVDTLILIPSSINELLVLDAKKMVMDYAAMTQMVDDVNKAEVSILEQLDPVVYEYVMDTNTVSIVASAR